MRRQFSSGGAIQVPQLQLQLQLVYFKVLEKCLNFSLKRWEPCNLNSKEYLQLVEI